MSDLWMVFVSVFLAELGDKTQFATLLFATQGHLSKWGVFAAASLALITTSAIAVVIGAQVPAYLSEEKIRYIAGPAFIAVGIWIMVKG